MRQRSVHEWSGHGWGCAVALVCMAWQAAAGAQEQRHAFNFVDADLHLAIQLIADFTDRRFIVDSRVLANVTLEMATPQTPAEVIETFKSLLEAEGLALVQAGNDLRVVPGRRGKGSDGLNDDEPDRVISRQNTYPPEPRKLDRNEFRARPPRAAAPDYSREVSLQAVRVGRAQRGYRIYPRGDAAAFTRLGFDPGDLVLSINGQVLNDAARGEQIFNEAIRAESVAVRIERAGRLEYLLLASRP